MRVVVAPDKFAGTLTARQAAGAIVEGWSRSAPDDEFVAVPLSDGGPGFLDILAEATGGELLAVTVAGPLGDPVPATVLLTADGTAYVEAAQACGLDLVPGHARNPGETTTAGVGELLRAAQDAGARRVVVGLGGSGTNDGGAGLLAALGATATAGDLRGGGQALDGLEGVDLAAARRTVAGLEVVVATDVAHRLLGPNGATEVFAPQKGASREQVARLEAGMRRWAMLTDARLAAAPGAGAAGGLGFGLLLLGAVRRPGVEIVAEAARLDDAIRAGDLVVTGEGAFDHQSLQGKVVAGVAAAALACARPVVVLAGRVEVGRREMQALGVESAYGILEAPTAPLPERPAEALAALAARVARTWSPRR